MDRILIIEGFEQVDAYSQSLRSAGFAVERARPETAMALVNDASIRAVVVPCTAVADRELVTRIRKTRVELPMVGVGVTDDVDPAMLCISEPIDGGVFVSILKFMLHNTRTRRAWRDLPVEIAVSATEAKNEFAMILETAVARGPVCIQKHGEARAVLIAWDSYEKLTAAPDPLDLLREEYDSLLERMQRPGSRERMQSAFDATPEELGAAAVSRARRGG
jgi:antitoxin Phd